MSTALARVWMSCPVCPAPAQSIVHVEVAVTWYFPEGCVEDAPL
ncbi:hypothetical protein [Streptomyces sp. CBMA152]|nr:hypothetical protein [Streptomyces sp. CBMA152]